MSVADQLMSEMSDQLMAKQLHFFHQFSKKFTDISHFCVISIILQNLINIHLFLSTFFKFSNVFAHILQTFSRFS